ncbi:MAG: NAD-dependent deacylase [Thermoplasmata archaeon]|nr:NAD-dependent deacylase [Thermoplasmata archaeon]
MKNNSQSDAIPLPPHIGDALATAQSVVVLTGAGVSAESGVPTFRGKDGLWRHYRVEELATPQAFARNPLLVWEWYDWRRGLIADCKPNPAHKVIAGMEQHFEEFLLITQNVDGLHRQAGNRQMLELHGNIWRLRCTREGTKIENIEVPLSRLPPRCDRCGGLLRPDVIWFGEPLDPETLAKAWRAVEKCDLMLVVGTSAVVEPAASLPIIAKQHNAMIIEINIEPTPLSRLVDHSITGRASVVLPELVKALVKE